MLFLRRPYALNLALRALLVDGACRIKTGFPATHGDAIAAEQDQRETMGDFLCRQDERKRSYQAPSADSSDDDVDETTLSGRAHLL